MRYIFQRSALFAAITVAVLLLAVGCGRPAGQPISAGDSLQFDAASVRGTLHSYFDGEADQQRGTSYPENGVSEDVLLLWARGLATPVLQPGDSRTVPLLMSLQSSRERHTPVEWTTVTLSRSATPQELTVPAGTFEVELWSAQLENGLNKTFYVEKAPPHRVVQWETSAGEQAILLGVERLQYWKMNGKGGEEALRKLGLSVRGPHTS